VSVAVVVIVFTAAVQHQVSEVTADEVAELRAELSAAGATAAEVAAAEEAWRDCSLRAGADLASGAETRCGGPPGWRAEVAAATEQSVATAARQGFVITLWFNALVLVASGLVVTARVRRTRADGAATGTARSP
jgi:hypothetical protein